MTLTLKYTLAQVRDRQIALVGTVGIPNKWWPLDYGADCLAFQLYSLGVRSRSQMELKYIKISEFLETTTWDRIDVADIRSGDLVFQNWDGNKDPDHVEMTYSIVPRKKITTTSANTGPAPGVPDPRGAWKKTRDIGPWLEFGVRPPYRNGATTATAKQRSEARLAGTWLNQQPELRAAGVPETGVGDRKTADGRTDPGDGITSPAPRYWLAVQTWGNLHGHYPSPPYEIDSIPGTQSRKVEAIIRTKAKAATKG